MPKQITEGHGTSYTILGEDRIPNGATGVRGPASSNLPSTIIPIHDDKCAFSFLLDSYCRPIDSIRSTFSFIEEPLERKSNHIPIGFIEDQTATLTDNRIPFGGINHIIGKLDQIIILRMSLDIQRIWRFR